MSENQGFSDPNQMTLALAILRSCGCSLLLTRWEGHLSSHQDPSVCPTETLPHVSLLRPHYRCLKPHVGPSRSVWVSDIARVTQSLPMWATSRQRRKCWVGL